MNAQAEMVSIIRSVGGDPLDLPFWIGCREGRFLVHRCGICERSFWPASRCISHGDQAMSWVDASGRGTLYTYTVMHHAYTAAMKGKTPYVVGVIQLDEGPFFHSNVVDCAPSEVAVGMVLEMQIVEHESGLAMPVFRPARR